MQTTLNALAHCAHELVRYSDMVPPILAIAGLVALIGCLILFRVFLERVWYGEPVGGRGLTGSLLLLSGGFITELAIS